MRYSEVHGHWPLMKPKKKESSTPESGSTQGVVVQSDEKVVETVRATPTIEV